MTDDDIPNNNQFTRNDVLGRISYRQGEKNKIKFFIYTIVNDEGKKRSKRMVDHCIEENDIETYDADLCYLLHKFIHNYVTDKKQDVEVKRNCANADELNCHLDELKSNETLKDYDSFFFIFLTFVCGDGSKELGIHLNKGKVHLEKVYEKLDDIDAMLNKPKVFLVQADSLSLLEKMDTKKNRRRKGTRVGKSWKELVCMKIPHDADRITIMSMVPSLKEEEPSPMIQAFVEVIEENEKAAKTCDFFSLTGLMNRKVENMINDFREENENFDHKDLRVPLVTSTLRKQLLIQKAETG